MSRNWPPDCKSFSVGTSSEQDSHEELLRHITEISAMCEQMERAVRLLIQRHDGQSEAATSARTLQASVAALKPQLLE